MAKISIIGSGYIGETVGKGFMSLKHDVIFYDVVDKNLPNFTRDMNKAVQSSDISFLCVPTPTKNDKIDLDYITGAVGNIGQALAAKQRYHLLVVKSSVIPTTAESVILPLLKEYRRPGQEFGLCSNPEFLTQNTNWTDDAQFIRSFFSEERIIIGEYDKRSGDILEELYKPLNKRIFRTDLKTAEMIKYAANCMLAAKISYWNEIFLICQDLGIDSQKVADIAALDARIGKYGSIHGKAFGGACLPKDLKAFIKFAQKHADVRLLKAVDDINRTMIEKYGKRD
jgi:UDPglucose 6-dehydrogenase